VSVEIYKRSNESNPVISRCVRLLADRPISHDMNTNWIVGFASLSGNRVLAMPSSKLDYLSKYVSTTTSNTSKKDRKRKKKEKKSKQVDLGLGTSLHDDNLSTIPGYHRKNNDDDDDDDDVGDEDEGPVVVEREEMNLVNDSAGSTGKTLGVRQEVNLETGAISTINEPLDQEDLLRSGTKEEKRGYHSPATERVDSKNKYHQRRHDSDSSEDDGNRHSSSRIKRRRHDAEGGYSNAASIEENQNSSDRRRHDSDTDDYSSNDRKALSVPTNRPRHDSDNEEDSEIDRKPETVRSSRRRYDSDDEKSGDERQIDTTKPSLQKRRRHDSDSDGDSDNESRERMSSGHKAGLQRHNDFNKSEQKIQKQRQKNAQLMVDKYGMGETVYRDKDGRKIDKVSHDKNGKPPSMVQLDSEAQRRLNQGKVQQQALEAKAQEMAILQKSAFARHQDDDQLEESRKNEIRKEDPMAHYATKKRKMSPPIGRGGAMESRKPIYKGPPPKPNRYGIRPGYRWDGVDRGNGFEDKILVQKYSAKQKEEEAYRWRSADM
jgi:pre-mRNA-splicing factor CWC26